MRVAALYDIHANLPALEAVLEDVRQAHVERLVVGGDVLPGPMPVETLDRLLALDVPTEFIHGNGDREVLERMRGVETEAVPKQHREPLWWTARQLTADHERVLASWPMTVRVPIAGLGDVLFCHATPRNDTDIFTQQTSAERLLPLFGALDVALVVCGHTHMPFDRTIGRVRVVNAGSVGMPFGRAGADWLLLGPDIQFRHTDYDLESAADRIRRTAGPQREEFADRYVLNPPSEAQILEAFAAAELK